MTSLSLLAGKTVRLLKSKCGDDPMYKQTILKCVHSSILYLHRVQNEKKIPTFDLKCTTLLFHAYKKSSLRSIRTFIIKIETLKGVHLMW